jgi:hypothetical protein
VDARPRVAQGGVARRLRGVAAVGPGEEGTHLGKVGIVFLFVFVRREKKREREREGGGLPDDDNRARFSTTEERE